MEQHCKKFLHKNSNTLNSWNNIFRCDNFLLLVEEYQIGFATSLASFLKSKTLYKIDSIECLKIGRGEKLITEVLFIAKTIKSKNCCFSMFFYFFRSNRKSAGNTKLHI